MKLNRHPELEGKHAFLSASQYAWIRYDDQKILDRLDTSMAAARGTRLHAWAAETISLGLKQPDTTATINRYINDAIGFRMMPEIVIMASYNVFGTADTLSFRIEPKHPRGILRIHDLKTGVSKASFDQLCIYAAMFCIEYKLKPTEIDMEFRIYQNDDLEPFEPDPLDIVVIMQTILHFDEIITERRKELLD